MSDSLVQFQEWLGHYPSWAVAAGIGFVVVVAAILLWKALRIAMMALIVAIVVGGGWYLWEQFSAKPAVQGTSAPAREPTDATPSR